MGSDVSEVQETPLKPCSIKVHLAMCTQLLSLVDRISCIFPDIEAARPRCSLGIQALCQLRNAIEKARKLVQNCCESSKLYLAITGDTVVSRFERTRNLLEQSLSQLQSMVPVILQSKISEILYDLRDAIFSMDPDEEQAGKALLALLQGDVSLVNSVGNSEIEVLQFATERLRLTSQKDLLIERRSIRKLFDEVKEENSTKVMTLRYLLKLLKKYDKQILQGQTRNASTQRDESCLFVKSRSESLTTKSNNLESHPRYEHGPKPPEEFKCPLSSRLMSDPVIISSGQTFDRAYIQKWLDEGHDTCPKTGKKLSHRSLVPNTIMRDLILKWSVDHGIISFNPNIQTSAFGSLETSSNSICSTASSMKDIHLQIDMSSLSLGSLDSSYNSDFSLPKVEDGFNSIREPSDIDSYRFQFYNGIHDIKGQFLSNVNGLPWETQCRAVQDVKYYLTHYNPSCAFVSSENFLQPLIQFLKDALDKHDGEAQIAGTQLFSTFLRSNRREAAHITEDIYALLASFLRTQASQETLAIMEILSTQESALPNFASSGALNSIIKLLDAHNEKDFQETAIRILHNLSSNIDTYSCKLASDWIPKLVPFLGDNSFSGICILILENLCKYEEGRVSIAETDGCIASIIGLLEMGTSKDQEHGVGILLSLCSQREVYCHLVLHEGAIPSLCHVSINGNEKGKISASELLRVLRDIKYEDEEVRPRSNGDQFEGRMENFEESNKSSRTSGSFGKKMKMFFRKK